LSHCDFNLRQGSIVPQIFGKARLESCRQRGWLGRIALAQVVVTLRATTPPSSPTQAAPPLVRLCNQYDGFGRVVRESNIEAA
jgi:hypothetical protein